MVRDRKSFGERNFGGADPGDGRRSQRLPKLVDEMERHPGGTLPQKLPRPEDFEAFYRLCDADDVTHDAVVAPHPQRTLQFLQTCDHFVLAVPDATELDFTTHSSLQDDLGQIGNGHHRGYLAQNTLVVDPQAGVVVGLARQILHVCPHVAKGETQVQRREVVDVCDRGADTFEFFEHEVRNGRTFVIRSAHNRSIDVGHATGGARTLLHEYARTLPEFGHCELAVTQKLIVKKPKKTGPGKPRRSGPNGRPG